MRSQVVSAALLAFGATSAAYAEVEVSTKGGFSIKDDAKGYSTKVGGRLQLDYNRSELNGVVDENTFTDRRARLYVSGAAGNWGIKAQFNIDGSGPEDLYVDYNGWGGAKLRIGKHKMPFALEELISDNDITVLERSALTENYSIGREYGASLSGKAAGVTYAIGAYDSGEAADGEGNDFGFAGRVTTSIGDAASGMFHIGLAYKDDGKEGGQDGFGLDAAAVFGGLHLQAEYFDIDQGSVALDGYYLQAGYMINGTRPYTDGVFKRVTPKSDAGAWEVVARFESGDGNHSDIELGRTDADAYTIGLNYYLNSNVRFGVNYTEGDDNSDEDSGNEFRFRTQFTF